MQVSSATLFTQVYLSFSMLGNVGKYGFESLGGGFGNLGLMNEQTQLKVKGYSMGVIPH